MSMSALISLTAAEAHHGRGRELYGQDGGYVGEHATDAVAGIARIRRVGYTPAPPG
jgi:hypothetical protein